jgi:Cft2 family RNA processing exonuclease
MAIQNTTLVFFVFLLLATAKYRVARNYSTPNVIEQMLVLHDNTLAVGFYNVIQIIDATDYQTVKQEIHTISMVSNIFLSQTNGTVVFLQSGAINSVAKK